MGAYHSTDDRDCVRQIMLRGKVSLEFASKAKLAYVCKGHQRYNSLRMVQPLTSHHKVCSRQMSKPRRADFAPVWAVRTVAVIP